MHQRSRLVKSAAAAVTLGFLGISLWTTAHAVEPVVPGLNELVVLDPGAHERGLPAVRLQPSCNGNHLVVDIPPTLHVHRYYYSGDKEFQGPIIQGGPTVVVANHPKTGQRMYINVTLPSGTPRIAHHKCGITYVYPDRRVTLKFSLFDSQKVTVQHACGQGISRRWHDFHSRVTAASRGALQRSPLAQSLKQTTAEGGRLVWGAKDDAGSMAAEAIDSLRQMTGSLPGVSALGSYARDRPIRRELQSLGSAAADKARSATQFMSTNR